MSVTVFFSYSHDDEALRDQLSKHLSVLRQSQMIKEWYDRKISAGTEWEKETDYHLRTADIILLLVSSDFISSDYRWDELKLAMQRHDAGKARVIPIILRSVNWRGMVFGKLQVLPRNTKPVKSWADPDEAFTDIALGIEEAIIDWQGRCQQNLAKPQVEISSQPILEDDLRSEKGIDYKPLQAMLEAGKWREADAETLQIMCQVTGREWDGWLDVKDIQRFPCQDLRTIDALWVKYSDGKFGFSVQKKIWQECDSPKNTYDNWKDFGECVGWRVNNKWISGIEVISDTSAPKGHLPLWPLGWYFGGRLHNVFGCRWELGSYFSEKLIDCNI